MNCPSPASRTLFLDGELSPAQASRLRAHLDRCPGCAEELRTARAIEDVLGPASDLPLPIGLVNRALGLPDRADDAVPRWISRAAVAALAAAALLLVVWISGRERPAPSRIPTKIARSPRIRSTVLAALRLPPAGSDAAFAELGDAALVPLHRIAQGADSGAARAALVRLAILARRESLSVLLEAASRPDRREEAIRALVSLGDRRALTALLPLLRAGSADGAVLPALASIGGEEAANALAARIGLATEPEEFEALVATLARVDGPAGARALVDLLGRPELAPVVVAELRKNRAEIVPSLLVLAAGRDPAAADGALWALAELSPPEAVPALAKLLSDRDRREAAARALARIDTPEAARALFSPAMAPEVVEAFRLAGPEVEAWLLDRLAKGNGGERALAVDLLARCGGERAAAVLATLVEDASLAPRIVRALGEIGGDSALDALERLMRNPWLRFDAISAFGAAGGEEAVPALVDIASRDRSTRGPVLSALAGIPTAMGVSGILLLSPGRRPGEEEIRTLEKMDRKLVVEALESLLAGGLAPRARSALEALEGATTELTVRRAAPRFAVMN